MAAKMLKKKKVVKSEKRCLSEDEIESLLDFIVLNKAIPLETARSEVELNKNRLRSQLRGKEMYISILPKLKDELRKQYELAKIQSGENVGILTAQSFGQFQTQSTLNTFHKAGMAQSSVLTGVPRFSEILSATKYPKGSACIVPFVRGNESIESLRKTINSTIVEFSLGKLAESMKMCLDKEEEDWYGPFALIYNDNFKQFSHCVSISINKRVMVDYSISLEQIAKCIENSYADLFCVFSPLHEGRIDVFVDVSNIDIPESKLFFVTEENIFNVYIEDVVIPKLEQLHICGIKGISAMFYSSDKDGKWFIETEGTNFSDLLAHPDVDFSKVMTNDFWEICINLGVEAARQYLIEELANIMSGINPCHSKLLVDKMTFNGAITSFTRYAQRGESNGALSKASFEETSDNLMNAALNGERECTDGVSASIICGKLGKFGTGVCELKIDVLKLTENDEEILEESIEEWGTLNA